jgi:hypothetical protein
MHSSLRPSGKNGGSLKTSPQRSPWASRSGDRRTGKVGMAADLECSNCWPTSRDVTPFPYRKGQIPHFSDEFTLRFPHRRWRVWRSFPVHEQPSNSNTRNAHRLGASGRLRSARFSAVQFSGSSSNRPGCHGLNAPKKSHPTCFVTPRQNNGATVAAAPHDAPHPNSSPPEIPQAPERPCAPPWPPSYHGER